MFKYLTKIGLNDVPEELLIDETVVEGLVPNDNKKDTSEMVEIKEELPVKLTAMSRNKITKLNRRFGEQGNCRNTPPLKRTFAVCLNKLHYICFEFFRDRPWTNIVYIIIEQFIVKTHQNYSHFCSLFPLRRADCPFPYWSGSLPP